MVSSPLSLLGAGLLLLGSVHGAALNMAAGGGCTRTVTTTKTVDVVTSRTTVTPTLTVYYTEDGTKTTTVYAGGQVSDNKLKRQAAACHKTTTITSTLTVGASTTTSTVNYHATLVKVTKTTGVVSTKTVTVGAGPTCTGRSSLTDITSSCSGYNGVPFCAIKEGDGTRGYCENCVPRNYICTADSQCCSGMSCSAHDAHGFGYCRPYSANATGLVDKSGGSKTTTTAPGTHSRSTVTATATAACSAQEVTDGTYTWLYAQYYAGSGRTLSNANAGNNANDFSPYASILSGSLSDCDAVKACAQTSVNRLGNYWNFDLHYSGSSWYCVQYINGNSDVSAWNVTDATVTKAVWFQRPGCLSEEV